MPFLGLDVDCLIAVDRILNRRREQPRGIGAREAAVDPHLRIVGVRQIH